MNRFIRIKYFAFFLLTFAVGSLAGEKIKNFSPQYNGFTKEEALSHLNKKVKSVCNAKFVKSEQTSGRTAFIDEDDFRGGYLVVIDWDYSLRGKHEIIHFAKAEYERCVIEVGEAER